MIYAILIQLIYIKNIKIGVKKSYYKEYINHLMELNIKKYKY